MKTKLILLLFLLCNALALKSQINMADSTVQVITYWGLNESYNYEITQTTETRKGEAPAKTDSISMKAKVTVMDSTATSYTIMWEFSDYNVRESAFSPKLETLLKARKFVYRTDELGSFEELLNWEEVRDNLIARSKEGITLISEMSESDEFKENIEKAMNSTLQAISTKEYVTTKEIEQVQLFHTFMGSAFKLGEVIESEIQTPNSIYPDKPLDAQVTIELLNIYEDENYYTIRYTQSVDEEQLLETTKKFIGQMAKDMGKEVDMDEATKGIKFDQSSYVVAAIDLWGWPLYIEYEMRVNTADSEKTITTTIELVE